MQNNNTIKANDSYYKDIDKIISLLKNYNKPLANPDKNIKNCIDLLKIVSSILKEWKI